MSPSTTTHCTPLRLGSDSYRARPLTGPKWLAPDRWIALENDGHWITARDGDSLVGEWVRNSPSLFLTQRIDGPYAWTIRATRVRPSRPDFAGRFACAKHTQGAMPQTLYNVNFWLRADVPVADEQDGGDFLSAYSRHLGSGWNGMGDDHWRSYFCTVVRHGESNWSRLRRGPGYEMLCDTTDVVPPMEYDQPRDFAFVVSDRQVRAYCDDRLIFSHEADRIYSGGYIGLCVWMCAMRFEDMKLYELGERTTGVPPVVRDMEK